MSFRTRVLAIVKRIPRGRVATYGDVARLAGVPRAWRAVGNIMRDCPDPGVPCHRVIGAGGALGGYGASGPWVKRSLLVAEGLVVRNSRVRSFASVRWEAASGNRTSGRPLSGKSSSAGAGGREPGRPVPGTERPKQYRPAGKSNRRPSPR